MTAKDRVTFLAGLVVLAAAAGLGLGQVFDPATVPGYDMSAYRAAADRLLSGGSLYADDPDLVRLGPYGQFLYPPPVALAFVPLALLPLGVAVILWTVLLEVVAVAVAIDIARSVVPAQLPWVVAALLYFPPLLWDVNLGNTATLTLALCWAAWRLRDRPRLAGPALAGAVGIKLLPLLLVVFFVASGRLRIVLWAVVTLAAVGLVTWPVVGSAWDEYLRVLGSIARSAPASGPNVGPAMLGGGLGRLALIAGATVVVVAAGMVAARVPAAETRGFAIALAAAPLLSTTIWYPYLTLALPLLVFVGAADPLTTGAWRISRSGAAARALVWSLIFLQLFSEPDRQFTSPFWGLVALLAWAAVDLVGQHRARSVCRGRPART